MRHHAARSKILEVLSIITATVLKGVARSKYGVRNPSSCLTGCIFAQSCQ